MDVYYQLEQEIFVWDSDKDRANQLKHGLRFEIAAEAFLDPFAVYHDASVESDLRNSLTGENAEGNLLFVVPIVRENRFIRIISARYATKRERIFYEEYE